MSLRLTALDDGIALRVKVVPGASRQRIVGAYGDAIKLAVTAAPERGAANEAVIELLAGVLGIARSAIRIASGHASPRKEIVVNGLTAAEIEQRLLGE